MRQRLTDVTRVEQRRGAGIIRSPAAAKARDNPWLAGAPAFPMAASFIHPTALVAQGVSLGEGVHVGAYVVIHPGVELGAGSFVGSHCELGVPLGGARLPADGDNGRLVIGPGSTIRSGSILYTSSSFGPRLECGHRVTIRENTVAGDNLRVGTLSDIQGDCRLGDYVRLHGNVQVGKGCVLGSYVWIFPFVVLTNDPHPPSHHCIGVVMEDFAVLGAHSVVLPGVRLGRESVVGAGSVVKNDVEPGVLASGSPAKKLCMASILRDRANPARKAYPWKDVFDRGLPWQGIGYAAWRQQHPDAGLPSTTQDPL
jgi:acetyltransferase-like isoleucine patch superfamily enzyme